MIYCASSDATRDGFEFNDGVASHRVALVGDEVRRDCAQSTTVLGYMSGRDEPEWKLLEARRDI